MHTMEQAWDKPAIRIGRICVLLTMVISFAPNIYLYIAYGVAPSIGTALAAWGAIAVAYGAFYVVEPLSYYPIFGAAGTYLAILTGSMANLRLPASITAQKMVGVEKGSKKAELVSTLGICGSVIMSLSLLTVFVIFGSFIMTLIPEALKTALTSLIVPAVFGALFVQFAIDEPKIAIAAFPIILILNLVGVIPAWVITVVAVFGSIGIARIMYDKGWLSKKKEAPQSDPQ